MLLQGLGTVTFVSIEVLDVLFFFLVFLFILILLVVNFGSLKLVIFCKN